MKEINRVFAVEHGINKDEYLRLISSHEANYRSLMLSQYKEGFISLKQLNNSF